ncbi:MAG: bifunctional hydroxymethylpyrimidine kinase/phosphomethylpyrimidine kinase [Rhodobiaceae bacterium]|nr:bifunctional hydroxymethylpyrimidine kinase/phosphomethylpyrimidine kinase [Rhodobiaceae bacterium]MCC0012145.1 bifunctional hydroxymethylpyrimidine kinase/phosphomethylpyrimidine kinase [Rhodobiaceae bacterium]MCC0019030.1 bifunctional hydroxymethylpyrimidine kinase/phosphomethylpyrimidine kinase [Rhodobiaceae bacterium]MCC0052058.1 bifunctional hydroxymethylpyrimidine kinase/phosphomethylpyrimidine kinase [Rhodobiaceae bacterium]MCC0060940.1 bifunctional hydroxymethylpyrimidine kinase/phos
MIPIAVTIAGSDSGGGAGIQADLKTFSALEVYGASVIAALTAQNTLGVTGVMDVPPEFVTQQIDAVYSDLDVAATKIGMLSDPATIRAVAAGLKAHRARNIVLDPVMVATSGDPLLKPEAVKVIREELMPLADLVTPNMHEAAVLAGGEVAGNIDGMILQGRTLLRAGAKTVLVKGGHLDGDAVDVLVGAGEPRLFSAPRIETSNTHGTGCTLSSAIAARLAHGDALEDAIAAAKSYLSGALAASGELHVGSGHGPVHHFHALWKKGKTS